MANPRPAPKKPNPERLRRRALHYLQRFATSRNHLRFVLLRRAGREAAHHEIAIDCLTEWVDKMLDDFERIGLLNDRLYAEQQFDSLIARGHSLKLVSQKLRQKGLGSDLIETLLAAADDDLNRQAAFALARRKRIGPWRRGEVDPNVKRKELAMFARAGFSYGIAREIIEADSETLDR